MVCPKCGGELKLETELFYIPVFDLENMEIKNKIPYRCANEDCLSYYTEETLYGLDFKSTELKEGMPG